MKNSLLFSGVVFIMFYLTNCSNGSTANIGGQQSPVIENIDAEKFKELSGKGDGIILDVRTPEEVAEGHLKGASFLDFHDADFENKVNMLKKDKPVYVYCRSGRRSAGAAEIMQKNGFRKVYNLNGGITAWGEKGFEIVKPQEGKQDK